MIFLTISYFPLTGLPIPAMGVVRKDPTNRWEVAPETKRSKVVCPDPGFYRVRDKEVQSDSADLKGNFVADERKLVRTQRKSLAISENLQ